MARLRVICLALIVMTLASGTGAHAQIPGQFAQDFVAGRVPSGEEIAALEQEVAAHPDNFRLTRKLGKGYFFQFFGEGRASSAPKAQKTLERALAMNKDDGETTAYLGALAALESARSKDPDARKALGERGLELLNRARALAPQDIAVLVVTGASFIFLADQFGTAALAAESMEKIRKMMGPMFARFSHHGQQRVLLTQGQAYAKMGLAEKARACFEEGLKVDGQSPEAAIIKAEMDKLNR